MKLATYITSYLIYPPQISKDQIRGVSGALVHQLFIDEPIPYNKLAELTFEEEFEGLEVPEYSVIKMSKRKYIDDFFNEGLLQIGTFRSFQRYDDPEIGDKSEGSIIIVGQNSKQTAFAEIGSGFNNYVFCCFDGEPNQKVIRKFGYDDYFEIKDVNGFAKAIQNSLNAKSSMKSKCIYKGDKVLVGKTDKDFDFNIISSKLNNLVNKTKYFIKTEEYEHQNEFRFLWEVETDVNDPIIIKCPEAIKFCRR